MTEERVEIPSGGGITLEGLYRAPGNPESGGRDGAVVCHPHPLYGGSMRNNVVEALAAAFHRWGAGTLRFNFRGVGGSGGSYAEGEGEAEDVKAAVSHVRARGAGAVHLAAYSFGAWVALKALRLGAVDPASLVLVSPPLDFLSFEHLALPRAPGAAVPCLITLGEHDDFCSSRSFGNWLAPQLDAGIAVETEIFPRGDHFYGGRESALAERVARFLERRFATGVA